MLQGAYVHPDAGHTQRILRDIRSRVQHLMYARIVDSATVFPAAHHDTYDVRAHGWYAYSIVGCS